MKTFIVNVTVPVEITFDPAKFNEKVMTDFNGCISDFGLGDDALEQHAIHLADLVVVSQVDPSPSNFVEGYGPLKDAGIKIHVDNLSVETEMIHNGGAA